MEEEHFQEASDTLVIKALLMSQSDVSVGNDCCLSHYHQHSKGINQYSSGEGPSEAQLLLLLTMKMKMMHTNTNGKDSHHRVRMTKQVIS